MAATKVAPGFLFAGGELISRPPPFARGDTTGLNRNSTASCRAVRRAVEAKPLGLGRVCEARKEANDADRIAEMRRGYRKIQHRSPVMLLRGQLFYRLAACRVSLCPVAYLDT